MPYDRTAAVRYAHEWVYRRNPQYLDFSALGGDCTNFVSQCLLAGGAPMNYTPDTGWYYITADDRAPAWTGVEFLYDFLMQNQGVGPYAQEIPVAQVQPGDVVQLAFDEDRFGHTVLVVATGALPTLQTTFVAAHTTDNDFRPLATYTRAVKLRFLQVHVRDAPEPPLAE